MPEQTTTDRNPEPPLVQVENLVKHFPIQNGPSFGRSTSARSVRSVDGVSFTINRGEVLGLVGESGCGKSTLARLVLNHIRPDSGSVTIDGQDVLALRGRDMRRFRRSVQMVFQNPAGALDPKMRIEDSLLAPLSQHKMGTPSERASSMRETLKEVGLDPAIASRYPEQCSGGQLQRVVIARALLLKPKVLICDEPTSAVDASIRAQLLNLLERLRRRFNLTLLMISHDLRAVRHISERVAVMYLGHIVEVADAERLFASPAHPYTRALIAASLLDEIGLDAASRLISGDPPSPINPPSGCHFHPRCPLASDRCRIERPHLQAAARVHDVACHNWTALGADR